jgi:hypothetical protein
MASFSAQLRVAGHVFPVLHCSYHTSQTTDNRGRVAAKVRHHPVEVVVDVPDVDVLLAWAADPHKRLAADIVFLDSTTRNAIETLRLAAAYCVGYHESFTSGDTSTGAYQCHITLSDPDGFTVVPGGPSRAFVAPAAREHGTPVVSSLVGASQSGPVSNCSPQVTARLQMQVQLMCKTGKSRCMDTDSCPSLLEKIASLEACILARETIMNQCFGGGDTGHKKEVQQRKDGVKRCTAMYTRQCSPRPEPRPVPVRVPSREPTAPPALPLPTPAAPATLAGAALLILYILTSALRPGPI